MKMFSWPMNAVRETSLLIRKPISKAVGSLHIRQGLLLLAVLCFISPLLAWFFIGQGTISRIDTAMRIGANTLGAICLGFFLILRRSPPPVRKQLVISMGLFEIINECVYMGYRVEALTDSLAVLVQIRTSAFLALSFLILLMIAMTFIPAIPTNNDASPDSIGLAVLNLSLVSFLVVTLFLIAGFGYDRLVFHGNNNSEQTATVVTKISVLPSTVRSSIVSTKVYPYDHLAEDRR